MKTAKAVLIAILAVVGTTVLVDAFEVYALTRYFPIFG